MTSIDGLMTTNNPDNFHHITAYNQICKKHEDKEKQWINELREQGFKASHPNDGWVDREKNIIRLVYPQFDDGAKVGDKIMLGWHSDKKTWRPIVLTKEYESLVNLSNTKEFYFKEIEDE